MAHTILVAVTPKKVNTSPAETSEVSVTRSFFQTTCRLSPSWPFTNNRHFKVTNQIGKGKNPASPNTKLTGSNMGLALETSPVR